MNKKEINKLLKDKKFKKLVNEIKRHAKDIDKQEKQFHKTFEKIVKTRKKFEKQLAQLKR
jgi:septal ring factor EnvC (AmiA/AmiB activator)